MADSQRKTANLFDGTYTKGFIGTTYIYKNTNTSANCAIIPCEPSTTYTVKKHDDSNRFAIGTSNVIPYDEIQLTGIYYVDTATTYTFTTDSSAHYMVVYVSTGTEQAEPRLMVNTGSTALPYEPYWQHSLRKIGDYADAVSGISVPTTTGKDAFDVLTTLKPSEVSLAYTGWHDASVKEWDGSEWQ